MEGISKKTAGEKFSEATGNLGKGIVNLSPSRIWNGLFGVVGAGFSAVGEVASNTRNKINEVYEHSQR